MSAATISQAGTMRISAFRNLQKAVLTIIDWGRAGVSDHGLFRSAFNRAKTVSSAEQRTGERVLATWLRTAGGQIY